MIKSGIYKITNILNGKFYIGSSSNILKRWEKHIKFLRKNKHHSRHLQNAWNLYGEKNFIFEILEEIPIIFLLEREQYYLNSLQSFKPEIGYNICSVAGSTFGIKYSNEARKKISLSLKGKKQSKERMEKYPLLPILQYTTNKDFIKEWRSITSASKELNIAKASIIRSCKGKRKSAGNFIWEYKNITY